MSFTIKYLHQVIEIINLLDKERIELAVSIISDVQKKKGRVFFIGVGGSAANCSHAVNDFRKLLDIECYAPTDNVSELSARTNDEGWDSVFKEYLKISQLSSNDLLFILSVGGGNHEKNISSNIINAMNYAKSTKSRILSIVGKNDGHAAKNSDVSIIIPQVDKELITPHAEEFQAIIWHLLVSHPILKVNDTKW